MEKNSEFAKELYLESRIEKLEVTFIPLKGCKSFIDCPNYPELSIEATGLDGVVTKFKEGVKRKAKNYSPDQIDDFFDQL